MSQQPPPSGGRDRQWPPEQPPRRPQPRQPQPRAQQPQPQPQRPGQPEPRPPQPAQPARPAPRGDQPTEYIPRIDDTDYLPRVQDGPAHPEWNGGRGADHAADQTEFFGAGLGDFGDEHEPYADEPADQEPRGRSGSTRPPRSGGGRGRVITRTLGEVLITAGMVVLLFVVYEIYITGIFAAQKQANATTALDKEWQDTVTGGPQRTDHYDLTDGHGIAKLYIPSLGQDYHFTVIEGTNANDLAIGPGHYTGTALPGQPGNFAVAGHRVGEGAPFNDLDLVQSCDAIVVETQTDWFVYRMLPKSSEVAGWANGKGKTPQCAGTNGEGPVQPLGGTYSKTVGQEIVLPSEGDVVATVPHYLNAKLSTGQEVALLTLTTCNPKFSAAQRLIVHAVLVKDWKKDPNHPDAGPPEMKETS